MHGKSCFNWKQVVLSDTLNGITIIITTLISHLIFAEKDAVTFSADCKWAVKVKQTGETSANEKMIICFIYRDQVLKLVAGYGWPH